MPQALAASRPATPPPQLADTSPDRRARRTRHRWIAVAVVAATLLLTGGTYALMHTDNPLAGAAPGMMARKAGDAEMADSQASRDVGVPGRANLGTPGSAAPGSAAPGSASTASAKPTTVTAATANGDAEAQFIELVNVERASAGCSAVAANDLLTKAARAHSADMAQRDYFFHDTPEGVDIGTRVTNVGYDWSTVGENIAVGQANAQVVMRDWMSSSGHKANILNCAFRDIGMGLVYSDSGQPYWTQDFGTAG